jgi:phosphoribosylglycinamide formyltransferase-1
MEAILKAIDQKKLHAHVAAVVSNEPQAPALKIAKDHGVETIVVPNEKLKRQEHEKKILEKLKGHSVDFVILAGYMRILSPYILNEFADSRGFNRVVNIHPSLLPAFPGMNAYEDAFAYGVKVSGITIHFVDEKVDHGPILAQESFPRLANDSLADFRARGLATEHRLYPETIQKIAQGDFVIHPFQR